MLLASFLIPQTVRRALFLSTLCFVHFRLNISAQDIYIGEYSNYSFFIKTAFSSQHFCRGYLYMRILKFLQRIFIFANTQISAEDIYICEYSNYSFFPQNYILLLSLLKHTIYIIYILYIPCIASYEQMHANLFLFNIL